MKKKGNNKIIYDIVHGYIEIMPDMLTIIDDQSFQRLKFISQMTANHLYPSANHTRFEHSLGVMKLAEDFFDKLEDTLREYLKKEDTKTENEIINDLKMHLLYSALLHDVGHAPLSHLGESLYDENQIEENIVKFGIKLSAIEKGSAHEKMSCLVILKNLKDKLEKIYSFDYELLCRIITGTYYNSDYWYKDIVISIVNSKTIDVDKLDYLLRDNFMTGKVGPEIDIKRLIESVTIFRKKLVFSKLGLSSIQKVIDCRDSIYLWVCNHHTVVYTDYIYLEILKHMIKLHDWYDVPQNINMDRLKKLCNQNHFTMDHIDIILKKYIYIENTYIIDKDKINENEKEEIVSLLKKVKYLPYPEAISIDELFSCDAITDKMVTDNEALYYIKKAMNLSKIDSASFYSKVLVNQLLN